MKGIVPLGDQAALAYFADEAAALQFNASIRRGNRHWLVDVVQAYTSVAVFFDPGQINFAGAAVAMKEVDASNGDCAVEGQLHVIPCCYEMGTDLERIAEHRGLTRDEVVRLHSETVYTVYAIGFCPGFPFLGYLPDALAGVPRLKEPRLRVDVGGVGLTGRQTGIYTEPRPGGWNLVGRTPLQLVDVADEYFPLQTGDRIRFERIGKERFEELKGKRLGNFA